MKTPRWVANGLVLVGATILLSCGGDDRLVAGKPAGSETSDELSARVLDSDGKPVAGAIVRLRPAGFLASDQPAKGGMDLVSDSVGKVKFPSAPTGEWWMEIRGEGKGLFAPVPSRFVAGVEPPPFVLRPFGGIRGKVDLPWGCRSALVRLVGVDRVDTTDTLGMFHLENLAPSDSALTLRVSRQDDESMIAETLVQIKPMETLDLGKARTPTILLSDFEHGLSLGLPWPEARWYVDKKLAWLRDGNVDTMAIGHSGKALRVPFVSGASGVVFLNANFRGSRDFQGLDSVEIWVKGKGGVSFYLYSAAAAWPRILDTLAVDDTSNWTRFVVKPQSVFEWRSLLQAEFQQATGVSIKFESSGFGEDLSIDDVRLYGVSLRDWH